MVDMILFFFVFQKSSYLLFMLQIEAGETRKVVERNKEKVPNQCILNQATAVDSL